MTIKFEFRLDFPKFDYNKRICKYKGHIWEKWEEEGFWSYSMFSYLNNGEPEKQCKRCKKIKYKKIENKTVSFSRHTPLKKKTRKGGVNE